MKTVIRALAGKLGYSVARLPNQSEKSAALALESFHSDHYLRHNARRLEHLATLNISVSGKRVLGSARESATTPLIMWIADVP
jgi:hypothetical protein